MSHDEIMLTIVKAATVTQLNNRVHHLEVYQTPQKLLEYPCALYALDINERNGLEVSGISGYLIANYKLTVVSKDSDILRAASQKVYDLAEEDNNETNYTAYGAQGFDWLDVDHDQEAVEYAIELEDKGYKTTTLLLTLFYRELTNNARGSE